MRVGIVGLGYRLGYLARVFQTVYPDFRVVGYVDPAPAGLSYMREFGVSAGTAYRTPEALLCAERLDLLMIGSPNHLHLDHIRSGLEHEVLVFCEKPVVATVEQSFELARLIARHGPERVLVGLVLRYAPLYVELRRAQADGLLGEIVSIEASEHIEPAHGAFFMRDWRRYQRYAGSFMLEKCCHDLDLYNGVVGARPLQVASFGGRKSFVPQHAPEAYGINDNGLYYRKPSGWMSTDKVFDSDADIIDYQTAIVEYANGAAMAFHTNMNVPDQFRRFCIIGARGMAEGDFIRAFLRVHDAHSGRRLVDATFTPDSDLSQHYGADERMAADICAHVMKGTPLPVSVIDAIEAGLLALAMDEARRRRAVVNMADTWARLDDELAARV